MYRIYISGPISGHDDLNEPAFRQAAARVAAFYEAEAIVPHDVYKVDTTCRAAIWCRAMVADLTALETCDAIYFIPGWRDSTGACRELSWANRLGLRLIFE